MTRPASGADTVAIDFFVTAYPRHQLLFVLAFVGLGKLVGMTTIEVVALWVLVGVLWAYYYFQLEVSEWASQEEFAQYVERALGIVEAHDNAV